MTTRTIEINVNLKPYIIECKLTDDTKDIWECTFPKMTLKDLAYCIEAMFDGELSSATMIIFEIFNSTIILENKGRDKDFILSEIAKELVLFDNTR